MRFLRTVFFSCLLVFSLAACGPKERDGVDTLVPAASLYLEAVSTGQRATLDSTETIVRDSATWATLSASLAPREASKPVDFSQTFVLLAALPQQSGGFRIEFEGVEVFGDTIEASYVVFVPGNDCITAMGRTVPFQAVAARRADGPVVFRRRTERVSCSTP